MDKPIRFDGLERFKLPECETIPSTKYDEYGNASGIILIKINSDRYIEYTNDIKIGITAVTSPKKDLISAIMELGDNPTEKELADFFSKYGFFLSIENLSDTKYTEYSVASLTNYINYIQKNINLISFYTKYMTSNELEKDGFNYTEICNMFIDVLFSQIAILNDSLPFQKKELGYDYADDFREYCRKYKRPSKAPVFKVVTKEEAESYNESVGEYPDCIKLYDIYIEPFEDFVDFCITTEKKYSNSEIQLFHFLKELSNNNYLKYENDINDHYWGNNYDIEHGIPHVIDFDKDNEPTLALQKELMHLLPKIINIQINKVIKNVYPIIEYNSNNSVQISWNLKNLLCVIFMELANIEMGGFECRCCCKDNCPIKGSYYFIIDAKNNSRTCYDLKCRNKINKRLFDEKKKKADSTS